MVRFFDQPFATSMLISGAIHITFLVSLSLRYPFSSGYSEGQPILVKLLEAYQPQEKPKPIRETPESKKTRNTSAKQEAKKSAQPGAELLPAPDQPRAPAADSLTKSDGLNAGAGQAGEIATVLGRGLPVSGERGAGGGQGSKPPNPGTGERGFREARPIQMAKASYPPMALRMGLEADVTLKVSVDSEGRVTKVEVIKTGGMGFDEEALKAVKQFRFEPARKDGEKISSEFTYIYRFRLEK